MESVERALEATEQREGDLKRKMAQNEADAKAREASAEVLGEVAALKEHYVRISYNGSVY